MWPIIACSVVALAIIVERLWVLRSNRVVPENLVSQVWKMHNSGQLTNAHIVTVRKSSPLGRILAAGLVNRRNTREIMKESIEDTGRQVVIELERFLNTLGTIALITPLLGLLGTVFGMIEVFAEITVVGVGDPAVLSGGIFKALHTTAAGLTVAIPTLMFHRYFEGLIQRLVLMMEEQALMMVEVMKGERERERDKEEN